MGKKTMAKNLAETIRDITLNHVLKNNGFVVGQCLSAVGWVQNTVPNIKKNIIELPMTDTAGAGFAVGMAIANARPIFILRFQSFLWLNSSPLIMHAAKVKELFDYSSPIFIRAIASEGVGSGPLHTNCYHSPFAHMPGLPICAPMTPNEYKSIWKTFIKNNDPLLVSEHRRSYKSNLEFKDITRRNSKITFFVISATRFNIELAQSKLKKNGIDSDVFHLVWLKPFKIKNQYIDSLNKTKIGVILDSSYEICSISENIACSLMQITKAKVYVQGMKDFSPGTSQKLENMTPTSEQIFDFAAKLLSKR
jgi:pyruvate/2-oxoglutarate/acetoin dehydrogenase E1 component